MVRQVKNEMQVKSKLNELHIAQQNIKSIKIEFKVYVQNKLPARGQTKRNFHSEWEINKKCKKCTQCDKSARRNESAQSLRKVKDNKTR